VSHLGNGVIGEVLSPPGENGKHVTYFSIIDKKPLPNRLLENRA
jgi:hypothetical protein